MASSNENHRLFVVYHLPFLKALNGSAVVRLDSLDHHHNKTVHLWLLCLSCVPLASV